MLNGLPLSLPKRSRWSNGHFNSELGEIMFHLSLLVITTYGNFAAQRLLSSGHLCQRSDTHTALNTVIGANESTVFVLLLERRKSEVCLALHCRHYTNSQFNLTTTQTRGYQLSNYYYQITLGLRVGA